MITMDEYDDHLDSIIDMAIYEPRTQFIVDAIMDMCSPDLVTTADILYKAGKALDLCANCSEFISGPGCTDLMDLVEKTEDIHITVFMQIEMETPLHFNSTLH